MDGEEPEGLGYAGSMRFGTASTILQMVEQASAAATTATYPFLILHDPEDKITFFAGSQRFHDQAGTPASLKSIVAVTDGRHDLVSNELIHVTKLVVEWLDKQV